MVTGILPLFVLFALIVYNLDVFVCMQLGLSVMAAKYQFHCAVLTLVWCMQMHLSRLCMVSEQLELSLDSLLLCVFVILDFSNQMS